VPSDYPSITAAVNAARDGDVVEVDDGHYLESEIVLDKKITLRAKNLFGAVICGRVVDFENSGAALIRVRNEAVIEGFILKYGYHGIVQRDSPNVLWRAKDLVFLDLKGAAISIDDRFERTGRAEVERLYIDHCGVGLFVNDTESLRARKIIVKRCRAFLGVSNAGDVDVNEALVVDCRWTFDGLKNPGQDELAALNIVLGPKCYLAGGDNPSDTMKSISMRRAVGLADSFFNGPPHGPGSAHSAMYYFVKGDLYAAQGNASSALACYEQVALLAQKSGQKELWWQAEFGRALVLGMLGKAGESESAFRKALKIAGDIRSWTNEFFHRLSFRRRDRDLLESYLEHLLRGSSGMSGDQSARRALEAVEGFKLPMLSRSRRGIDMVAEGRNALRDISRIQRRILASAANGQELHSLRVELGQAEARLADCFRKKDKNAARGNSGTRNDSLPLEKLRPILAAKKEALLEYYIGPNSSFGLYVDGRCLLFKKIGASSRIRSSVKSYFGFKQAVNKGISSGFEGGAELFEAVIGPFARELSRNAKKIHVIPDDILCYLPFEALVWPGAEREGRPQFLVETHEVSYGVSLRRSFETDGSRTGTGLGLDLLAVGNSLSPVDDPRRAHLTLEKPRLKYAAAEAKAVTAGFTKNKRIVLLDREATEGRFRSAAVNSLRFLHIATHGIVDDREWWRSALVFYGKSDGYEDGLLSPPEIALLELDVELAVLSACQTGLGLMQQGSGVMGFIDAFLAAGAKAVVASIWNVDDRAAAKFMSRFYRHLAAGMKPASALRRAKLDFLNSGYGHPFYWAPFLLTRGGGE